MKSADLKAYASKTHQSLEKLATKHFNAYIRWRDSREIDGAFVCISCRELKPVAKMHAGHFYSAGHHSILQYDEDNVHGQCHRCNTHLHGNLNEYRLQLERKIGKERMEALDQKARHRHYRRDRWTLIEIILTYQAKLKNHVLEKSNDGTGRPDHYDGPRGIQPQRGKLFQFTGGGEPTRTQVWRQEDPQKAE